MSIVDKAHASQIVTKKGKQFKFDSIECLIPAILSFENGESQLEYILVSDYMNPGTLINAKDAFYLISPRIKSPMGMNLSAFSQPVNDFIKLNSDDDQLFSWSSLNERFASLR